jgi:hypothetical protein
MMISIARSCHDGGFSETENNHNVGRMRDDLQLNFK